MPAMPSSSLQRLSPLAQPPHLSPEPSAIILSYLIAGRHAQSQRRRGIPRGRHMYLRAHTQARAKHAHHHPPPRACARPRRVWLATCRAVTDLDRALDVVPAAVPYLPRRHRALRVRRRPRVCDWRAGPDHDGPALVECNVCREGLGPVYVDNRRHFSYGHSLARRPCCRTTYTTADSLWHRIQGHFLSRDAPSNPAACFTSQQNVLSITQ